MGPEDEYFLGMSSLIVEIHTLEITEPPFSLTLQHISTRTPVQG